MKRKVKVLLTLVLGAVVAGLIVPFIPFLVIVTTEGGFGPGVFDFSYPVAGDYILVRSSAHQIHVHPNGVYSTTDARIPPKVVRIGWDDRFVIGEQIELVRRSPSNPDDTYKMPGNASPQYWILDTATPKSYGPLSREEFETKRNQLAIPEALKLQSVYREARRQKGWKGRFYW